MKGRKSPRTAHHQPRVAARPLPGFSVDRKGSLLLEAIIGIGIFAIFLAGIGLSLLVGEKTTVAAGDRVRGAFLAEQQLEGVRQMRNVDYDSVTTGTHGIQLNASGWTWSGSVVRQNGYTGSVTITGEGTDWLKAVSKVRWDFGKARSGSVLFTTYLTNWRKLATVGNWASISRIANMTEAGTPNFQSIAINGTYAFVTGTQASGGRGLYIYDISNPASPVGVNTSFDLGVGAYGVAIAGNDLYLATDSPTQEVQVYDITSPTTLTIANLINSYDLPGSGKARSIAVYGNNVFVGTLDDPPNVQLYSIEMSQTGPMILNDSINMSGSTLALGLQDGYAYAATSNNAAELEVVDIFDPESLSFAPGTGVDMTDVQDAYAIALSGTSALIGRANGSTIDELTLYEVGSSPVPSPPPGPWTLEIGGDVRALGTVYGSAYAFVGGSASAAQLKVISLTKMAQSLSPILTSYNAGSTIVGLQYDWVTDRLFCITSSGLMVFSPG